MSGTKRVSQTIIGKSPGEDDEAAKRFYNQKLLLPILQGVRNVVNQLAGDWIEVTESQIVEPPYQLILVDSTDADVILTLREPSSSHREYLVVKKVAAHTVTVVAEDGSLISGSASVSITDQWGSVGFQSTDTNYYAFANQQSAVVSEPSIFANISTDQDNYSPTGWSSARRVFLNVTATCNINGFDANVTQALKTIFHVGTTETPLGLMGQKLSSTAANRIEIPLPNDVYMLKDWVQDIWYDTTVSRWRPV